MDIKSYFSSLGVTNMSLMDVVSVIAAMAMIFGGIVPYIPQYRTVRRTLSSDGFSTLVCFVLLLANMLRVAFWFGKRYELPLLAQSILMIIAMFAMVEVCVRVKNQSEIIQPRQHAFRDLDWTSFWKWTDFLSYVECMLVISAILTVLTYLFIDNDIYIETLGFLAVFIEAMLGTPQLHRNFTSKSTAGMSVVMVAMWLMGDVFKTVYFFLRSSPVQFWVCGCLQISVDIAILAQVFYYSAYPVRERQR